ncbi:MAG: GNAT family protein [Candidatus Omnitrophica bacterium]|nr:GNAT family protein [Candidatus Omnitrophota bacterium]MDD5437461.1 GNAT family protein [Candidatus Omnitrophota bacterium]
MKTRPSGRPYIYETANLCLRGLQLDDLKGNYANWFNDREVCKYNSHGAFPKSRGELETYIKSTLVSKDKIVWAIIDKKTLTHIGNVCLQCIDWINRSAEFAVIIGEKDYWGKGYAGSAASLLLKHGFDKMNLNRIYCGTAANNTGMKRLALRLNMRREGVRRQALYLSGKYVDAYEYGILRDEFKKTR